MADARRAAFLDRDGTIIVEREYLADPAGVELLPGAGAALRRLAELGYALVVVTNQSGIARGFYGAAEFEAVQAGMAAALAGEGVRLDGVYYCPHHPDFTGPCECRKPGTRLYRRAAADLALDLAASLYVGDKLMDVIPAAALGGLGVLVRTGYGAAEAGGAGPDVVVVDDLDGVAKLAERRDVSRSTAG